MKITAFILVLTFFSFTNIFAQSYPFSKIKTPDDATAYLKLISENFKAGDEKLLPTLIKKGADVEVINKFGVTPLLCMVLANSYEGTQILLDASANPNVTKPKTGGTPLFFAAQMNNLKIVQALINAKADVNRTNSRGLTPLFIACVKNAKEVSALLLNSGANPNISDTKKQTSPLHIAAERNSIAIMMYLMKAKANINAQTSNGATPLFMAASKGHALAVQTLLIAKANKHLTATIDKTTRSPLLEAQAQKHGDIVKLLNKGLPRCNKSFEQGIWDVFVMADYYSIKLTFDKVDQSLSYATSLTFERSPNGRYSFDTNLGVRFGVHQIFVDGIKVFEGKFKRQSNGKSLKITLPSIDLKTLQKLTKGKMAELRIMQEQYKKAAVQKHTFKFPLGEDLRKAFYKAENDLKIITLEKNEGRCYQPKGLFGGL
tara:strand:+ start:721 stop:2013 length:1293 start_codon:yes stop_codon:yes gene_type:complete